MIDTALVFLRNEVNDYLKRKPQSSNNVQLVNFSDTSPGTHGVPTGCVGMGLINIEQEATTRNAPPYQKSANGSVKMVEPEVKLNLYVLFAANRTSEFYNEALRDISNIIAFFQSHRYFDTVNAPRLDANVKKLVCDLHSVPLEQVHYMWSALQASYLPSVVYKVRLVGISDNTPKSAGPGIQSISQNLNGKT